MKQKKKNKNYKLAKKIAKQHLKKDESGIFEPYVVLTTLNDLKSFARKNLPFLILVGLIIFLIYFNSLNGAFVSDDIAGYLNNPIVKDIGLAFSTVHWQNIMYATVFSLFKDNPIPLHLISVIFHILSVYTFFFFISNFFSKKVAIFSAIIFAVHPLASEAVIWISANNYLVYAIFTFSMAITYIMYRNSGKKSYLYTSVGLFSFITLFTRSPQVMTLFPIIIIVDQFLIEKKLSLKNVKDLSLYLIPVFLFLLYFFTIDSQPVFERISSTSKTQNASYLSVLPYVVYMPIRLMIFPDKLTLYHDAEQITEFLFRQMWVITILISTIIIFTIKKNKKVAALMLIAPASFYFVFSPFQIAWFFAERYVYLGISMFAVLLILFLFAIEKKTRIKNLTLFITVIIVIAFSTRTFIRSKDWKTRKTLWESTQRVVPFSSRTYNNLGDVYAKEGNMQASIQAFSKAIELNPTYDDAIHNLGFTYLKIGELDKAEEYFFKSLKINPELYQSYFHLSLVELERQNYEEAKQYAEKTLQINRAHEPSLLLLRKLSELN